MTDGGLACLQSQGGSSVTVVVWKLGAITTMNGKLESSEVGIVVEKWRCQGRMPIGMLGMRHGRSFVVALPWFWTLFTANINDIYRCMHHIKLSSHQVYDKKYCFV